MHNSFHQFNGVDCEELHLNKRVQELKIGMAAAIPFIIVLTGRKVEESSLALIQQSGQIVEEHLLKDGFRDSKT